MINTNFNSILELIQTFSSEQVCIEYLEQMRWGGIVESPFDSASKVYKCSKNRYKCRNTGKYFNVKTGSMFENTKISLQKWFLAIWLLTSGKKGISSVQLAKDIGVTQKQHGFCRTVYVNVSALKIIMNLQEMWNVTKHLLAARTETGTVIKK